MDKFKTKNILSSRKEREISRVKSINRTSKPLRKIGQGDFANSLQISIIQSFSFSLKLEPIHYGLTLLEEANTFSFLRKSVDYILRRTIQKRGYWPKHVILPKIVFKNTGQKSLPESNFSHIFLNGLKDILDQTKITIYRLWDLKDFKILKTLKKKLEKVDTSQKEGEKESQDTPKRHVKIFISNLYQKERKSFEVDQPEMALEGFIAKKAFVDGLCQNYESLIDESEAKKNEDAEIVNSENNKQDNDENQKNLIQLKLMQELKDLFAKVSSKENDGEICSSKATNESSEGNPTEYEIYQSLRRLRIQLKQKKNRENTKEIVQKKLGEWFCQEMTIEELPYILMPSENYPNDEDEENMKEDTTLPQKFKYILRKIFTNLYNINERKYLVQNGDKYSPKTWKFKIGGFHKSVAPPPFHQHQGESITFPDRLYHPFESPVIQNQNYSNKIYLSDKKRSRQENTDSNETTLQSYLSPKKRAKLDHYPQQQNSVGFADTPLYLKNKVDSFDYQEGSHRGILESFKKYKSEAKEAEQKLCPPTIHCNYILNNPVISNRLDFGQVDSRNMVNPDLFILHNSMSNNLFPYQQSPSTFFQPAPKFQLNVTDKVQASPQEYYNRGIRDTNKAIKKVENSVGLSTPTLKNKNKEQYAYQTPSTENGYSKDILNAGSAVQVYKQQNLKSEIENVSPYTPREMECLDLFRHFLKTPMTSLSNQKNYRNQKDMISFSEKKQNKEIEKEESSVKQDNNERLLICSEKMFQNQEFVESLEDFLRGEMIPIDLNNDLDGVFYVDNATCIVLFHDSECGDDYQKTILAIIKILIKESLKSSNILVLFLLDEEVLKNNDLTNARRKMFQALRALKVFFAKFTCNLVFGFPCDMKQLIRYIDCFCKNQKWIEKKKYFSDFAIKGMKKILNNYRKRIEKNIIWDMLWNSPCLNPIAVVEACYVLMEKNINIGKLIILEKEQWEELFRFLGDQQLVIIKNI